jgi:hypothetical protein
MTHDELLDKIRNKSELEDCWMALQKVVELHKPQDITLPNGDWDQNCSLCDGWIYPCQTIQAIEEELT